MPFTKEQIAEISDKLSLLGKTDSSFSLAGVPLSGLEEIAFVQDGQNVKMRLVDMVNNLLIYRATDFINISEKFNNSEFTLIQAIGKVVTVNRKAGVVITFIDSVTHDWLMYQYKGVDATTWLDTSLWDNIVAQTDFNSVNTALTEIEEDLGEINTILGTKVPYTGATANVNLGTNSITVQEVIANGGLVTEFLKANGSKDSTNYWHTGNHPTTFADYGITATPWTDYMPKSGGTFTGGVEGTLFSAQEIQSWTNSNTDYGMVAMGFPGADRHIFQAGITTSWNGFTVDYDFSADRFRYGFLQGEVVVNGDTSANLFGGMVYDIVDSGGVLKFKVTLDVDNKLSIYGSDGTTKLFDLDNDGNSYFKGTINAFNLTTHA